MKKIRNNYGNKMVQKCQHKYQMQWNKKYIIKDTMDKLDILHSTSIDTLNKVYQTKMNYRVDT